MNAYNAAFFIVFSITINGLAIRQAKNRPLLFKV
jgi:hypothetical protein